VNIHLGYEVGTGEAVAIPLCHLVATGLTQASGKTTTLWALLTRLPDGFRALAFRTKRGELEFQGANVVAPFYRERCDWRYVESLLEAAMKERLKFERSWIIRACKGARTLRQVYQNIRRQLESGKKLRGLDESVWTNLQAYFEEVLPQLEKNPFSDALELAPGPNVMNLSHLSEEVQALVISSCLEHLSAKESDVVVVIPEAWQFVPQQRGGPVKWAAQRVIRMGAVVRLLMWLDSQDVTGIDKSVLKSVGTWLLGRQMELNEVRRVINQLPTRERPRPEDVMTLKVGHFYAASEQWCKLVYVQPAWLSEEEARRVAVGELAVPPPPVQAPKEEEDPMVIAKLEEELKQARAQVAGLEADLAVAKVGFEVSKEEVEALRQQLRAADDERGYMTKLKEGMEYLLGGRVQTQVSSTLVNLDAVVAQVLARIGAQGHVLQVTPPEALRQRFQQEALARLKAEIEALEPRERKVIAWLEQRGETTSTPLVALHVEGREFSKGGRYVVEFSRMLKKLADHGLIKSIERQGYRPGLMERVVERLQPYNPTSEQVEQVYHHLLHLLLEEVGKEKPDA